MIWIRVLSGLILVCTKTLSGALSTNANATQNVFSLDAPIVWKQNPTLQSILSTNATSYANRTLDVSWLIHKCFRSQKLDAQLETVHLAPMLILTQHRAYPGWSNNRRLLNSKHCTTLRVLLAPMLSVTLTELSMSPGWFANIKNQKHGTHFYSYTMPSLA